jgi:signal transduction histidine kinase
MTFVGWLVIYDIRTGTDYRVVVAAFFIGIFALGLILGFRAAIWYATAVALFLLLLGLLYVGVSQVVFLIFLAYVAALPAKVVERLIEESTAESSKINVKLREEIAERVRAEEELREHREHLEELIQERTTELAMTNEQLREEIDERVRVEESLREQTVQLKARNEELDAFAHTVAHGLKSPMSVVIGFGEMLERYHIQESNEKQCRYAHSIAASGRRMAGLVDELLLLARVRKEEVDTWPLDMATIVAGAQECLAPLIEQHQAQIILPESWPVISSYGPWVAEVWANYLGNAIKYGGRPPQVELGATVLKGEGDRVRFWVRDNGLGLTPEEQARLFTPFTQLHQVRVGGHGLGLSIVQRIVDKLGGQVGVESEVGRGSAFSFTLPGTAAVDRDVIRVRRSRPAG